MAQGSNPNTFLGGGSATGLVPMAMGWSVDFRSLPQAFGTAATQGDFSGFGRILLIGGSNSQFWGPMAVSVAISMLMSAVWGPCP